MPLYEFARASWREGEYQCWAETCRSNAEALERARLNGAVVVGRWDEVERARGNGRVAAVLGSALGCVTGWAVASGFWLVAFYGALAMASLWSWPRPASWRRTWGEPTAVLELRLADAMQALRQHGLSAPGDEPTNPR